MYTVFAIASHWIVECFIKWRQLSLPELGWCFPGNKGGYQPESRIRGLSHRRASALGTLATQGMDGSQKSRSNMGKVSISTMKCKTPSSESVQPLRTLYGPAIIGITAFGKSESILKRKKSVRRSHCVFFQTPKACEIN